MFWIHWPFRSACWERWMEYCAASWSHFGQSWSNQAWGPASRAWALQELASQRTIKTAGGLAPLLGGQLPGPGLHWLESQWQPLYLWNWLLPGFCSW